MKPAAQIVTLALRGSVIGAAVNSSRRQNTNRAVVKIARLPTNARRPTTGRACERVRLSAVSFHHLGSTTP
jgi:hypothetical protein